MEAYNKLVRDKIPEILDQKGVSYEKRVASPEEYKIELIKKLEEELKEFIGATPSKKPEELADILEVIEALKKLPEYANLEEIRQKKLEERGGFGDRIILRGEK